MDARRTTSALRAAALTGVLLLAACAPGAGDSSTDAAPSSGGPVPSGASAGPALQPPPDFQRLEGVVGVDSLPDAPDTAAAWQEVVPQVQDVRIPSTADGAEQPALWLPPDGEGPQPLIVVLHSWSTAYEQYANTPYARWAAQEGWAMIAPNFRGVFERPEATGSDLAVQDVLDAVDWALDQGGVDPDRVVPAGYSGGGMMSLLMAGRHPDRFAGAVSFVPVYDLVDWYAYNRDERPEEDYAEQIVASCGGDPTEDPAAREECEQRSPRAHLDVAREAGLPIFLAQGLSDPVVPPDYAVRAFDQLADEQDRLGEDVRAAVADGELPDEVPGEQAESFFADPDPDVLLARRSGPVTLVLFEGEHDMIFHAGLQWMAALAERVGD